MGKYIHITAKEELKPTVLFLRSILEPRLNKPISITNVVSLSVKFLAMKIEDEKTKTEFIEFVKKCVGGVNEGDISK